jgi:tRNA (guanine37-N1)-methyltransferase
LKERLAGKLSQKELSLLRRAFDVVGDVAVVEIPRELQKKKKLIAAAVMEMHPNIKAVWMEKTGRSGKLRLQKLEWLAGEKRTETIVVENGVRLKLDVAKVYYSPRQASERERIIRQVRKGESVLVMFSGAGPYAIEIAKKTAAKVVYGVELNKVGHRYAVENAKLNKVEPKTKFFCGDVKKVVPSLKKKFDRIIMPLPKAAYRYLDVAIASMKKNGILHYYDFLPEDEIPYAAVVRIRAAAVKAGKKVKILGVVRCGQLASRQYRVCADVRAL